RDLILQLSKSSIYSTKPPAGTNLFTAYGHPDAPVGVSAAYHLYHEGDKGQSGTHAITSRRDKRRLTMRTQPFSLLAVHAILCGL
nr:hypothetical protein [Klebsiella pneumoniae]